MTTDHDEASAHAPGADQITRRGMADRMKAEPFDQLARALAGNLSRREAMERVARLAAITLAASLGLDRIGWAQGTPCGDFCNRRQWSRRQRLQCLGVCRGECGQDTSRLCGRVGAILCCPGGQTCCNHRCTAVNTVLNCGECRRRCPAGWACCDVDGQMTCVDARQDERHCGVCDYECEGAEEGWGACCDSICYDLRESIRNCGTCGRACGEGTRPRCCDRACVDIDADAANCGWCGNRCGPDQRCNSRCECLDGTTTTCGTRCCAPDVECCDGECCPDGHLCCGLVCSHPGSAVSCGRCGNCCDPSQGGETSLCRDGACVCRFDSWQPCRFEFPLGTVLSGACPSGVQICCDPHTQKCCPGGCVRLTRLDDPTSVKCCLLTRFDERTREAFGCHPERECCVSDRRGRGPEGYCCMPGHDCNDPAGFCNLANA